MHQENLNLKAQCKKVKADFDALSKFVENTGLFTSEQTSNLVRKRGRPPKGSNEMKIREARARAALLVSSHLQGMDSFARNVRDIVEVAIEQDPEIIKHLAHVLRTHGRKEVVPDGRTNSGTRVLPDSTHLGMRNGFLAQAEGHITNAGIEAIRKFGGRSVIDNPQMMQKWAAAQPEIPLIKFVAKGASTAVFTPLGPPIRDKLMRNKRVYNQIRTTHPYKAGSIFVYYMVRMRWDLLHATLMSYILIAPPLAHAPPNCATQSSMSYILKLISYDFNFVFVIVSIGRWYQ